MKILFKAYLVGLVPGSLIGIISNFDVAQATVNFKLSWWNVYLLVSYLVFLPLLYRALVNLWQMSDRVTKQVTQPRPHADQEAMRLGSNFANTGLFGMARIGDSRGSEGWIVRWGMSFVWRLAWVLFGPFIYGYKLWKKSHD